mgnify:CR=1 FL=1
MVHENPVVRHGPLIALVIFSWLTAPGVHDVPSLIECQYRRSSDAALTRWRIPLRPVLATRERRRTPVDHPDHVAVVHPHSDRVSEKPVVGERLWPEGIDLEQRPLRKQSMALEKERMMLQPQWDEIEERREPIHEAREEWEKTAWKEFEDWQRNRWKEVEREGEELRDAAEKKFRAMQDEMEEQRWELEERRETIGDEFEDNRELAIRE